MKHVTLFSGKRLFLRLALAAAMIVFGGGSALADTVIFSGTLDSGWTNNGFTQGSGEIFSTTWKNVSLSSTSKYEIAETQMIVIEAKGGGTGATLQVKISNADSPNWDEISETKSYTTDLRKNTTDYVKLEVEIPSAGNYYLYFKGTYITIKSITLKENISITDITELTFDEEDNPDDFSSFKSLENVPTVNVKYTAQSGWNTICMPIQLRDYSDNHMDTLFGSGWSAYTFFGFSSGTLTFSEIGPGIISDNMPLLVFAPNTTGTQKVLNLENIRVRYSANPHTTVDGVTFQGTYAPKAAGSLDGCYGVTASGQIAKGSDKAWMNGYRAYLTGIPDGSSVKMFVIDGDDATDVGLMQMVEGEDKAVYNISGQRVQKARKGLYIIGGKKVIIK